MNDTDPRPQRVLNVDMSRAVLRLIGILLILETGSLILGVAFFLMMHGLIFGVLWLSPYWNFARKIVTKTVGSLFPSSYISIRAQTHWLLIIMLFVKVAVAVVFFGVGLQTLLYRGFCRQNLICLALSR